jgi:hypothetical protein
MPGRFAHHKEFVTGIDFSLFHGIFFLKFPYFSPWHHVTSQKSCFKMYFVTKEFVTSKSIFDGVSFSLKKKQKGSLLAVRGIGVFVCGLLVGRRHELPSEGRG